MQQPQMAPMVAPPPPVPQWAMQPFPQPYYMPQQAMAQSVAPDAADAANSDDERVPRGIGTRIISAETALRRHTEDLTRMAENFR